MVRKKLYKKGLTLVVGLLFGLGGYGVVATATAPPAGAFHCLHQACDAQGCYEEWGYECVEHENGTCETLACEDLHHD